MGISRIAAGAVTGSTLFGVPLTTRPGDVIFVEATRDGSTTAPSLPTNWTNVEASGANNMSTRVAWLEITNEPFGGAGANEPPIFTNATKLVYAVYRGTRGNSPVLQSATNTGSSVTMNYPALGAGLTANSWILAFGAHRTATDVEQAPTGTTNQASSGAAPESAIHDSNGTAASWASANVTVNQNNGWKTHVLELEEGPDAGIRESHISTEVFSAPDDAIRESHITTEVFSAPDDAIRESHITTEVFSAPDDAVRQSLIVVEIWTPNTVRETGFATIGLW